MDTVNIRQLYDSDPRPTFIVDCRGQTAAITHVNKALLELPKVALCLHSHNALRDWWDPASRVASHHQSDFRHGRYRWTKFKPCARWLIITIIEQPNRTDQSDHQLQEPAQLSRIASPLQPRSDTIFTSKIQSPELREHIERFRTVNWAETCLGPIDDWSYELHLLITNLMLETRPTALFLGPDHIIVYNLAYGGISGSRHPRILGKSIIDAWPELADPVSATMARSQQANFVDTPEEQYHFMVERNDFVEEAFFMWSLVPLVGVGSIDGMYSIVTEVTKQRLLERRVSALLRVGQLTSQARNTKAFWASISEAMTPYEFDFPAAVLYSRCSEAVDAPGLAKSTSGQYAMEWTIGYADDNAAIPKSVDLDQEHGLAHAISDSARDGVAKLYCKEDDILPPSLFVDIGKRGFGDPCKAFIVIPVRIYDDTVTGYLIVGLNTRRPYDAEYQDWIEVYANLIAASAASVALHEEEARKRRWQEEQAAKDREALSAQVVVLAREASNVADKLQNFHEIANAVRLGYFEFSISGKLMHANEAFFAQTGHQKDVEVAPPFAFLECLHSSEHATVMEQWHTLEKGESVTFEVRWKKSATNSNDSSEDDDCLWTLTACVPIVIEGSVTGIFGCNTDISAQKEATRTAILRMQAERRLASFTELAPVGLFHLNADLDVEYCNDQWFRITDHPRVSFDQIDWRSKILESDLNGIYRDVKAISTDDKPHSFSFRLKKLWTAPDGLSSPTWLLATATAQPDADGRTTSFTGTMTDISHLKWAEKIQKNRFEEALESKRQQENFIDMTSHEMRNPLSAMVQCADSISTSLREMAHITDEDVFEAHETLRAKFKDWISSSLDAVDTIQACATHQKRIVDDILTLSKLDSKLLVISPDIVQPKLLLQDTYKMFKDEASKADVSLEVRCDSSITDMKIEHAILDPSRVLQVLINLITNAIKFTRTQTKRRVELSMGASKDPLKMPGVQYVPKETSSVGFLDSQEWCSSDVFYLNFTVKDTGCGLTPEHKAKLFLRFSQATPKTHVQYGGSGLGLFISRELAEMQGGCIGVQSEQGIGSTFSFYIKSRRADLPVANDTTVQIDNRSGEHLNQPGYNPTENTNSVLSGRLSLPASPHNYHILVVEDNLINQRVLCQQLRKIGCSVQVANHGGEALTELSKTSFYRQPTIAAPFELTIVLMDVEMPVVDGLSCTRSIREMERIGEIVRHVPIIAVSANARKEQIEQAREAGMDDAISKPFRIPELMGVIERLLARIWVQ